MIDPESARSEILARLPRICRWKVGNVGVQYDFTRSESPLRPITEEDLNGFAPDAEWKNLLVLGEEFVDGGASPFLAIDLLSGKVVGVDPERDGTCVFPLNSTLERFIETFVYLSETLSSAARMPSFLDSLRALDPEFQDSEWRVLAEYVAELGT